MPTAARVRRLKLSHHPINLWVKCLDDMKILSTNIGNEIKTLNATMHALTTKVEMLSIRTKMVKGAIQSGIINNGE